jgi:hypothetical protein
MEYHPEYATTPFFEMQLGYAPEDVLKAENIIPNAGKSKLRP